MGTEYHWYILAHQIARKLNVEDYSTAMTGMKFKLAHQRAASDKWRAAEASQRRRLIAIFEEIIAGLKNGRCLEMPDGFSDDGREEP